METATQKRQTPKPMIWLMVIPDILAGKVPPTIAPRFARERGNTSDGMPALRKSAPQFHAGAAERVTAWYVHGRYANFADLSTVQLWVASFD
jgi:hypothetical protein